MKTGGIILCGGRSSRMGRDKAMLPFGRELMLQRLVRIVRSAVDPVVVVAAPGQNLPELPRDVRIVRDSVEGQGPLFGLATGLAAIANSVEAFFLSSCDVPLLEPAFIHFMLESLGEHMIAIPEVKGFRQPLAATYRSNVRKTLDQLIAEGRRSLVSLLDAVPTRLLGEMELRTVDSELRSLRNVNIPEEYREALRSIE